MSEINVKDIDMSKLANANVALSENKSYRELIEKSTAGNGKEGIKRKKEKNPVPPYNYMKKDPRKFNFIQPQRVELPSEGKCYQDIDDEDVRNGYILLLPMTVREEEILSTDAYIKNDTAATMVLNNCIKSNIMAEDLLIYDFFYLLFNLRKISFGDKYSFNITCQNCGTTYPYSINISDIVFETLPDDFEEPARIDLPISNFTILMGMSRVKDIISAGRESKEKSEAGITIKDILLKRIRCIITSDGEELDRKDWKDLYLSLPVKDSDILIKEASSKNANIDKIMTNAVCPSCGETYTGGIPITLELFHIQ